MRCLVGKGARGERERRRGGGRALVTPLLHQLECLDVFVVDDPYEDESVCLQFFDGEAFDEEVGQLLVAYCDLGLGYGEFFWWWSAGWDEEELTPRVGAEDASCHGGSMEITSNWQVAASS